MEGLLAFQIFQMEGNGRKWKVSGLADCIFLRADFYKSARNAQESAVGERFYCAQNIAPSVV